MSPRVYQHGVQEVPQSVGFAGLAGQLDQLSEAGWECWQVTLGAKRDEETGQPIPMFLVFLRRPRTPLIVPNGVTPLRR